MTKSNFQILSYTIIPAAVRGDQQLLQEITVRFLYFGFSMEKKTKENKFLTSTVFSVFFSEFQNTPKRLVCEIINTTVCY